MTSPLTRKNPNHRKTPNQGTAISWVLFACAAIGVAVPLRLSASEDCMTLREAVAEAASEVRSVSETMDHSTEYGTLVSRDENGCYSNGNIVQGAEDSVSYSQGDWLISEAQRRGEEPAVMIHSHNYPSGSDYQPGLTGGGGDSNQTHGDTGFAESRDVTVIAVDTGPESDGCAHGYDPDTNRERTVCP